MIKYFWLALSVTFLLSACGQENESQLRTWLSNTKTQTQAKITPLPTPKVHEPRFFLPPPAQDPFSYLKIASLNRAAFQSPDGKRPREPLEEIPLEAIKVIGILQKKGQINAMISIDGKVQKVRVGQHMGQNYGRIVNISENGINLRELIPGAPGEWISKMTVIPLQNANNQESPK